MLPGRGWRPLRGAGGGSIRRPHGRSVDGSARQHEVERAPRTALAARHARDAQADSGGNRRRVLLDAKRPGAEGTGLRLRDDLDPGGRIDHDRALRRSAGLEVRQPLEVAHQPLVLSRPRTAERTRRGLPSGHGAENAASRPARQRQAGGAGPATSRSSTGRRNQDTEFLDVPGSSGAAVIVSRVRQDLPIAARVDLWFGALERFVAARPTGTIFELLETGEIVPWQVKVGS